MRLTYTIQPEFNDEDFIGTITLTYTNGFYENEISLCDHSYVFIWNDLISAIKTNNKFTVKDGENSSSTIEVKDGKVCIIANVSGSGGDITTTFKVTQEVFLPIAENIRNELTLLINNHNSQYNI